VVLVDLVGGSFPIEQISLVELLSGRGRRVLVLGDGADPLPTAAAVAAGAVGEVSRSAPFAALVEALEAAALGRPVMSDGDRPEGGRHRAGQPGLPRDRPQPDPVHPRQARGQLPTGGGGAAPRGGRLRVVPRTTGHLCRAAIALLVDAVGAIRDRGSATLGP
jgi:hypothetical protein